MGQLRLWVMWSRGSPFRFQRVTQFKGKYSITQHADWRSTVYNVSFIIAGCIKCKQDWLANGQCVLTVLRFLRLPRNAKEGANRKQNNLYCAGLRFNGTVEWIPLEGWKKEKCGNEELIGADKTARWLFDLCSYILEKLMFRNNKWRN